MKKAVFVLIATLVLGITFIGLKVSAFDPSPPIPFGSDQTQVGTGQPTTVTNATHVKFVQLPQPGADTDNFSTNTVTLEDGTVISVEDIVATPGLLRVIPPPLGAVEDGMLVDLSLGDLSGTATDGTSYIPLQLRQGFCPEKTKVSTSTGNQYTLVFECNVLLRPPYNLRDYQLEVGDLRNEGTPGEFEQVIQVGNPLRSGDPLIDGLIGDAQESLLPYTETLYPSTIASEGVPFMYKLGADTGIDNPHNHVISYGIADYENEGIITASYDPVNVEKKIIFSILDTTGGLSHSQSINPSNPADLGTLIFGLGNPASLFSKFGIPTMSRILDYSYLGTHYFPLIGYKKDYTTGRLRLAGYSAVHVNNVAWYDNRSVLRDFVFKSLLSMNFFSPTIGVVKVGPYLATIGQGTLGSLEQPYRDINGFPKNFSTNPAVTQEKQWFKLLLVNGAPINIPHPVVSPIVFWKKQAAWDNDLNLAFEPVGLALVGSDAFSATTVTNTEGGFQKQYLIVGSGEQTPSGGIYLYKISPESLDDAEKLYFDLPAFGIGTDKMEIGWASVPIEVVPPAAELAPYQIVGFNANNDECDDLAISWHYINRVPLTVPFNNHYGEKVVFKSPTDDRMFSDVITIYEGEPGSDGKCTFSESSKIEHADHVLIDRTVAQRQITALAAYDVNGDGLDELFAGNANPMPTNETDKYAAYVYLYEEPLSLVAQPELIRVGYTTTTDGPLNTDTGQYLLAVAKGETGKNPGVAALDVKDHILANIAVPLILPKVGCPDFADPNDTKVESYLELLWSYYYSKESRGAIGWKDGNLLPMRCLPADIVVTPTCQVAEPCTKTEDCPSGYACINGCCEAETVAEVCATKSCEDNDDCASLGTAFTCDLTTHCCAGSIEPAGGSYTGTTSTAGTDIQQPGAEVASPNTQIESQPTGATGVVKPVGTCEAPPLGPDCCNHPCMPECTEFCANSKQKGLYKTMCDKVWTTVCPVMLTPPKKERFAADTQPRSDGDDKITDFADRITDIIAGKAMADPIGAPAEGVELGFGPPGEDTFSHFRMPRAQTRPGGITVVLDKSKGTVMNACPSGVPACTTDDQCAAFFGSPSYKCDLGTNCCVEGGIVEPKCPTGTTACPAIGDCASGFTCDPATNCCIPEGGPGCAVGAAHYCTSDANCGANYTCDLKTHCCGYCGNKIRDSKGGEEECELGVDSCEGTGMKCNTTTCKCEEGPPVDVCTTGGTTCKADGDCSTGFTCDTTSHCCKKSETEGCHNDKLDKGEECEAGVKKCEPGFDCVNCNCVGGNKCGDGEKEGAEECEHPGQCQEGYTCKACKCVPVEGPGLNKTVATTTCIVSQDEKTAVWTKKLNERFQLAVPALGHNDVICPVEIGVMHIEVSVPRTAAPGKSPRDLLGASIAAGSGNMTQAALIQYSGSAPADITKMKSLPLWSEIKKTMVEKGKPKLLLSTIAAEGPSETKSIAMSLTPDLSAAIAAVPMLANAEPVAVTSLDVLPKNKIELNNAVSWQRNVLNADADISATKSTIEFRVQPPACSFANACAELPPEGNRFSDLDIEKVLKLAAENASMCNSETHTCSAEFFEKIGWIPYQIYGAGLVNNQYGESVKIAADKKPTKATGEMSMNASDATVVGWVGTTVFHSQGAGSCNCQVNAVPIDAPSMIVMLISASAMMSSIVAVRIRKRRK